MTEYAILLTGDENRWAQASPDDRKATYSRHEEFMRALAERGHSVTGGAELVKSDTTKVVRGARGDITITDGPYLETVEQLGGFYLIRSDDLADLLDVCGILADGDGAIEVRACVPAPEGGA